MNQIKKQWVTVSVDTKNKEELKTIAAQLTDAGDVTYSINDVVSVLIKRYKENTAPKSGFKPTEFSPYA